MKPIDKLFIRQAVISGQRRKRLSDEEIWRTVKEGNNKGKKYALETETGEITKGLGNKLTGEKVSEHNGRQHPHEVSDVSGEYLSKAEPGKGIITDIPAKGHIPEKNMANWLLNTFGGNITHIAEDNMNELPDYLWNGKLWELKSPETVKGLDKLIRKGIRQLRPNPGGFIVDCREVGDTDALMKKTEDRLNRSAEYDIDVIYVTENGFRVKRYKKA